MSNPLDGDHEAIVEWCEATGWHAADVLALVQRAGQAGVSVDYDEGRDVFVSRDARGAVVFERAWLTGHREARTAAA